MLRFPNPAALPWSLLLGLLLGDRGAEIDPDGLEGDRGGEIDPNGLEGDRGAEFDPDG